MPTIDEELIQNGKAVFHSKVEHTEDVTFGKNAEFDGKVQVNSAKDLATKDGTSFGLNIINLNLKDCMSETDYNELIGYILQKTVIGKAYSITLPNLTGVDIVKFTTITILGDVVMTFYRNSKDITEFNWICNWSDDVNFIQMVAITGTSDNEVDNIKYNGIQQVDTTTLVTKTDLNAKQSTLYRHSVLISELTNKTAYLAFTAESEKNTPIDSIQDLIAVFGNTSIACSGLYRDGDPSNEQSLLMINAGTSISNTTIASATLENSGITSFSNALFTDVFGTTGFTITDSVTAM